jgi:hypothetical protein
VTWVTVVNRVAIHTLAVLFGFGLVDDVDEAENRGGQQDLDQGGQVSLRKNRPKCM